MYKVLLVDDEPAILDAEKRTILRKAEGFEVIGEAYCVEQAIQLFNKLQPDVILTDIKMPKQTGIDLIKYVADQEEKMAICIAVSGYADFDFVHDAFMYGAFDYLLKPVEPDKLAKLFLKIRKLLLSTEESKCSVKLPRAKTSGKELVETIEKHVKNHLAEDNSIVRICGKFMISQPYLSKIFKKYKHCTYNEYLMGLKIKEAKVMLCNKSYLIGEIADVLGFSDQFYFSKVFKTMVGCTPREYRKNQQY